jgi:hypothetical protein
MAIRKINRSNQILSVPELTGGLTSSQAQDNECQVFQNVDFVRDKWPTTRAGTTIAHEPSALGSAQVTGLANVGLNDGSIYIVVAKQGSTFYYHIPDINYEPGKHAVFGAFTVPYACDGSRVNFETAFVQASPGTPSGGRGYSN